jgi:hypothetical protein
VSALTALMEALLSKATARGGQDAVGRAFLEGAERAGTFERGREFAKTPEGLAAQFDFGKAEPMTGQPSTVKVPDPQNHGAAAYMFANDQGGLRDLAKMYEGQPNGVQPFLDAGNLPDAKFYNFDTGSFEQGSGAGTRAYPTLYGNVLNEPGAMNIKDSLSGPNAYRNNYALASAIMRQPDAGSRLLASPEQFQHLPVDVTALRTAGPQAQVGALQIEGALQTLRRLNSASVQGARGLDNLPSMLSSTMRPDQLAQAVAALRASTSQSTRPIGPKALRRLGIVQDVLNGREVDPAAFKRLEFKAGGLAQLSCNCAKPS